MATTTNFDEWLEQAEPDGYEEVYGLYYSVRYCDTYGPYECKESNGGKYFLKTTCPIADALFLASDKARNAFLSVILQRYCNGEDIESWYGFRRAMEKND